MRTETRYLTVGDLEVRTLADGRREFRGYAIRFNEPSENLGGFVEYVDPSATVRALAEGQDVRHLINHDANLVLGRTAAGTTRLEADGTGVMVVTDLPDTTYARDMAVSVERGDISQMSFGFRVAPGGDTWDFSTSPAERRLTDIDLMDVSTVTFPAYPTTTAEVRSLLRENGVRAVGPALVAWDEAEGMCDFMDDVEESLPEGFDGTDYAWGFVSDCRVDGSAALVCWHDDDAWAYYVVPVSLDDAGEPMAAPQAEWVAVESAYVVSDRASAAAERAERRAGKAISSANAEHVAAIKTAIDGIGEHVAALADAAELSETGEAPVDAGDSASGTTEQNARPPWTARKVLREAALAAGKSKSTEGR